MTVTTQGAPQPAIEVYWIPGCSSCLRMKEFIEKTGLPYEEINLAELPERGEKLARFGAGAPAVMVGERVAPGLDLTGIANLIGIPYDSPLPLSPEILLRKYATVASALIRMISQVPPGGLEHKAPERNRNLRGLAAHAGTIMRCFLTAYDNENYDESEAYSCPARLSATGSVAELADWATETLAQFNQWWDRYGHDDPLDRVLETIWGYHTLQEILERSVWHTAQHTRQVASFLEQLDVTPDRPLSADDLAGLPLPDRIQS